MKKLLSIIGAISIVGSGASTVVACNTHNQDVAKEVKKKIDKQKITIPKGSSADASKDKTEIDAALKAATGLTHTELTYLSYAGTLVAGQAKDITVTIKVKSATAKATIQVTLGSNQTIANAVKEKITGTSVNIAIGSNTDASKDKKQIDAALQAAVHSLTKTELSYLTYAGTLEAGQPKDVTVNITVGTTDKATATIKVTLKQIIFKQNDSIPKDAFIKAKVTKINDTYYLGTTNTGLYTSKDGITWNQNSSIPNDASIACAPIKIGKLYFLSTLANLSANKGQLYTSTDGQTWTLNPTLVLKDGKGVGTVPLFKNNNYYLGTEDGLWVSSDGLKWQRNKSIDNITSSPAIENPITYYDDTFYLTIDKIGLCTSSDGISWSQTSNLPNDTIWGSVVKFDNNYYITSSAKGLWTSLDGKSWRQLTKITTSDAINSIKDINGVYYALTNGAGLWTSTDKGQIWNKNKNLKVDAVSSIFKFNTTYYLNAPLTGLYTSNNGSDWVLNPTPPANIQITSDLALIGDTIYVGTSDNGLWEGQIT